MFGSKKKIAALEAELTAAKCENRQLESSLRNANAIIEKMKLEISHLKAAKAKAKKKESK